MNRVFLQTIVYTGLLITSCIGAATFVDEFDGTAAKPARVYIKGDTTLTVGADLTVRGQFGEFYRDPSATANLVNQGLISADVSGGWVRVWYGTEMTNEGTVEARNGGLLSVYSGLSSSGTVRALAASGVPIVKCDLSLTTAIWNATICLSNAASAPGGIGGPERIRCSSPGCRRSAGCW